MFKFKVIYVIAFFLKAAHNPCNLVFVGLCQDCTRNMALNDLPSRAFSSETLVRGATFMFSQVKYEHDGCADLEEECKVI
jgi:hypothetical protein